MLLYVLASIAFCRANRRIILPTDDRARWAMGLLALEASMVAYALGATVEFRRAQYIFCPAICYSMRVGINRRA